MPLELLFASGERSLLVQRYVVHEAISSLFHVSVRALGPDPSLDLEALVGKPAALRTESKVTNAHRAERLWAGICWSAEQVKAEHPPVKSTYRIEIVPRLWLLTKRVGHRIFQHLSIPDIVDALLGEYAITPTWEIARGNYPKLELKVQYGESDFAFFSRLLEEAGITFVFEDTDDDTQLVLRDEPQSKASRGAELPFERTRMWGSEEELVVAVHVEHEVRPGAFVLQDYDFRRPMLKLQQEAPKAPAPHDKNELVRYEPGTHLAELGAGGDTPIADDKGVARYDVGYGKDKAARLLAGNRAGSLSIEIETNAIDLSPGTILTVANHVHPDVAGKALMVTHATFEHTLPEVGRATVRVVHADVPYRPPPVTPKPVVHGVQSATVVGARSATAEIQEIHTDEFGRIRVQFPWDRDGKADDFASCWIRVSQGWGGRGYGMIQIPRVGQEVLVTFLDGDPDQPVVTGRLFNALNPVPYKLPENKTISTWKGDSSPGSNGYNEIKFEDKKGEELFYHQAEKDQRVLVKHDETITVGSNRRKDVTVHETDTTGANRTEVTGANRSEVTAVNKTTLIGANRAKLVVRDKGVRNEGHRQTLLQKTLDFVVKGDKREWVQMDAHLYVKGDRREAVDDDRSFIVVKDSHEKIGASYALASGASSSYHADQKTVGEGGIGVSVKGPGGFLSIDATGVTISGTIVKINAGGSAGKAKKAKPVDPKKARELKQPIPEDGLLDSRGDANVSGLNKSLAAVASFVAAKPENGTKWNKSVVFQGTKVFLRDDLIDPKKKDKSGKTNLQRMKAGRAPVGPDGKPINLHHMIQSEKGSIAELSDTFHKKYSKIIHINPHTIPSGIDRKKFNAWKRGYWKQRAAGMGAK